MKRIIALSLYLAGAGYLCAQQPIAIGMTDAQVSEAAGAPTRFYDARLKMFTEQFPAVSSGPVWECHKRLTRLQEYDVRVLYRNDSSESRLHPVFRVSVILILFDKPVHLKDAYFDSPEIRSLCAAGCQTQVVQPKSIAGEPVGRPYMQLSDKAKTASIILRYVDEETPASGRPSGDLISQIEIEPYFSLEQFAQIMTVTDAGLTSSADWPKP